MPIKVQQLRKSYRDADRDVTVISDLTYAFPERGAVGIVGRSGIGKSTLMHLLGLLDAPTSGSVWFGEKPVHQLDSDERARFRLDNVGFIFQFHHLMGEFSAVENVMLPLIIGGKQEEEARVSASELLKLLGMSHRAEHRPGQLSGGEQQRVAIARALIARPKLLLADEPTGNLDVTTADEVQKVLLSLTKELGNLLIVVTHSFELARTMDLVLEMQPGGALIERSR